MKKPRSRRKQAFPPGWNKSRIQRLVRRYDQLDESALAKEDKAALKAQGQTLISVPSSLVPVIRELIARKPSA